MSEKKEGRDGYHCIQCHEPVQVDQRLETVGHDCPRAPKPNALDEALAAWRALSGPEREMVMLWLKAGAESSLAEKALFLLRAASVKP